MVARISSTSKGLLMCTLFTSTQDSYLTGYKISRYEILQWAWMLCWWNTKPQLSVSSVRPSIQKGLHYNSSGSPWGQRTRAQSRDTPWGSAWAAERTCPCAAQASAGRRQGPCDRRAPTAFAAHMSTGTSYSLASSSRQWNSFMVMSAYAFVILEEEMLLPCISICVDCKQENSCRISHIFWISGLLSNRMRWVRHGFWSVSKVKNINPPQAHAHTHRKNLPTPLKKQPTEQKTVTHTARQEKKRKSERGSNREGQRGEGGRQRDGWGVWCLNLD